MPARRPSAYPRYSHDRSTDRAYVWIDGRKRYLGRYDSPESRAAYQRTVDEWVAAGRPRSTPETAAAAAAVYTVAHLLVDFWKHAEAVYPPARRSEGVGSELDNFRDAVRPLAELYADLPASDFGPKALKAVRVAMVRLGWCRSTINRQVGRIKHVFRWGVAEEKLPASTRHALEAVESIRRGTRDVRESEKVLPVPDAYVDAVLPLVGRQVRAMIELQRLTGMRPGEVTIMRTCDVDTSGKVWFYRPARHKNEHHGHGREISLGPRAQAVLAPFLRSELEAYLFSPAEAAAERAAGLRAKRRTPLTPSQLARTRLKTPQRAPGSRYTPNIYRQAIARACERAFALPAELREPRTARQLAGDTAEARAARCEARAAWRHEHTWHPHQLRHNRSTAIRRDYGPEAAQIVLGDRNTRMVDVYAERDRELAVRIALEVG